MRATSVGGIATDRTVKGSQSPVEAVYVSSPEYDAWNANVPAAGGVCANAIPSATPLPSSVNGSDVAAAGAVQVPFVNQVKSRSPSASATRR